MMMIATMIVTHKKYNHCRYHRLINVIARHAASLKITSLR